MYSGARELLIRPIISPLGGGSATKVMSGSADRSGLIYSQITGVEFCLCTGLSLESMPTMCSAMRQCAAKARYRNAGHRAVLPPPLGLDCQARGIGLRTETAEEIIFGQPLR